MPYRLPILIVAFVAAFASLAAIPGSKWLGEASEKYGKQLYSQYIEPGNGVSLSSDAAVRKYFEPSLAQLIINDRKNAGGEVGALDGDPFVDAQDWEIKNLTVRVAVNGPSKSTVTVRFTNFNEAKTVTLSLVAIGRELKISDINWGGGRTLRGLFTR